MIFYNRSLQNDFLPKERKIVFYKPPIHSNLYMISLKYRAQVDRKYNYLEKIKGLSWEYIHFIEKFFI